MSSPPSILQLVRDRLADLGVFDRIECDSNALRAHAPSAESEAWYEITIDGNVAWVGLYTPDRWLSESIEADLMHQGDKIEELLEEELIEFAADQSMLQPLRVEHFRDDEKQYVFRSKLRLDQAGASNTSEKTSSNIKNDADLAERLSRVILAYEACFGQLGDMSAQDETV